MKKTNKNVRGWLLVVLGGLLIVGGFNLLYGLSGAMIIGGLYIAIVGSATLVDEG